MGVVVFFFFKQKTAYEIRPRDWSSDVCSSDLLVGAGLLTRSLLKLSAVNPGFNAENLLSVRLSVPRTLSADSTGLRQFWVDAAERLRGLPGVVSVTAGSTAPFSGGSSSTSFVKEGEDPAVKSSSHEAQQRTVMPGYFTAMGIRMIGGRDFSTADRPGVGLVLIVNEALAHRDWPTESPLGKRIKFQGQWREIIGVVGNMKYAKLATDDEAMVFAPFTQRQNGMNFMVRTLTDPAAFTPAVRTALREVNAGAIVMSSDRVTDLMRRSFAEERYRTTLMSIFGLIAVLLAAAGMYGVVSRAVGRRTREMGIRIALGATPAAVTWLVVASTLAGLGLGLGIGLAGSLASTRFLSAFLYGVSATDPLSYAGVVGVLGLVSLAAS